MSPACCHAKTPGCRWSSPGGGTAHTVSYCVPRNLRGKNKRGGKRKGQKQGGGKKTRNEFRRGAPAASLHKHSQMPLFCAMQRITRGSETPGSREDKKSTLISNHMARPTGTALKLEGADKWDQLA